MGWLLFLIAGLVIIWLRWRHKNKRMLALANKFPGPTPLPLLGNALTFMVKPEEIANSVEELRNKYGPAAIRFWLGPDLNIIVSDPDDLKLLLTNSKTSFKGPQYKYMADVIGGGILSGSGPKWRKHRKLATPNYGKRAVESYNDVINEEIDYLLPRLTKDEIGRSFNIYKQVVKTTSYVVCRTLMGLTREQTLDLPHLQECIDKSPRMYHVVFDRMVKWYLQIDPVFWLTSSYRSQKYFIKLYTTVCSAIIEHRKNALKDRKGMFKELMASEGDSVTNAELCVVDRFILSQELVHEEIEQETFTIFTSSQEASAKIASSMLLMMAYHPECQEKLYAEIRNVIGEEDRWISDEDLKRMPYLEMVFCETVRLFPIGAMIQRTINEDITISSGTIPAGCSLLVPVYHLQRDTRYWDHPNSFDPERFSAENSRLRHPNCYMPFSLGPMDCLGRHFGKKLIKMTCVRIIGEFKLTSVKSYKDLKMELHISATPIHGDYSVILHPRKFNKMV